MGGFSNPFRSPSVPKYRDRRRRNPRFAPESLESRLSLSDACVNPGPAWVVPVGAPVAPAPGPGDIEPPPEGAVPENPPPPPDGDGSPPDSDPVIPIGPSGPA